MPEFVGVLATVRSSDCSTIYASFRCLKGGEGEVPFFVDSPDEPTTLRCASLAAEQGFERVTAVAHSAPRWVMEVLDV